MKILFFFICFFQAALPQNIISSFDDEKDWQIVSSEGAEIKISLVDGISENALKIDYEFTGAGWCGIEKNVDMILPNDYKFSYYINGKGLRNNLEFKLVDSTGDNVWWLNQRNFEIPSDWQRQVVRKRNIEFAWGPAAGGDLKKVKRLQIILAASEGGKGTIHLDELTFELIHLQDTTIQPVISASSYSHGYLPASVFDHDKETRWQSNQNRNQWVQIDLGYIKEFGGIVLTWDEQIYAKKFSVALSNDGEKFNHIYEKNNGRGINDFILIKNGEARFIKINFFESSSSGYSIKEIEIKPLGFSDQPNNFFREVATYFPKGYFPKYFSNTQSFWNIVGVSGDSKEALINEEGTIEVDKGAFSISPYIFAGGEMIVWSDVETRQSLEDNYLPIPSVNWLHKNFELTIKTFAAGEKDKSFLTAQYRVENKTEKHQEVNLYLAIRPYQVNPPWQFLNTLGGASKIKNISADKSFIQVDNKKFFPLTDYNQFGASDFKNGEIITFINSNSLPREKSIIDPTGFGSAALKYELHIPPGSHEDVYIAVPFHDVYPDELNQITTVSTHNFFQQNLEKVISYWKNRLDRVEFNLPSSADKIINTLKSNLAYILINRDGPAIQPGSRSYERAWIRDGALTSSALLRLGLKDEVKEYLDWYSQYQFSSGKIPCVVDKRGADPTPENDSHGEYIFAVLQYFIFSKDTSFLKDKFESIIKTVDYIEQLINQRKTSQYQKEDSLAFYGLVPESISHEGYSAKPMHSYWDDFFTLRGLKDAAAIAEILNYKNSYNRFAELRDEFEKNLYRSIDLTMNRHNINYIPGSVELGDFDATSTTISIYPGNELGNLPQPELQNTFDKYYDHFTKRKNPEFNWDAYTPYEIRTAGTFLYLGEKNKTHELLDFFFEDQFPSEWNHWAEVVWKDKNAPKFIGDMPHTWIGSDYINVIRSIFVFEREYDSSLVIGLGLKQEWADDNAGISVNSLSTYYGDINYSLYKNTDEYVLNITGDIHLPPGGIKFINFRNEKPGEIIINGVNSDNFSVEEITISEIPSKVLIRY